MSGDSGESEDAYDETKETFKAFDKSGNDKITVSDLKSVLENLSVKLTTDELNGILEELESVGSELEYSGKCCFCTGLASYPLLTTAFAIKILH